MELSAPFSTPPRRHFPQMHQALQVGLGPEEALVAGGRHACMLKVQYWGRDQGRLALTLLLFS